MPPHDVNAEAAVLSAIMLKPGTLDEVSDLLEPRDFYSGAHRSVYEAILALDATAGVVDSVTVASQLRADGALARVGGSAFLAQIVDATPSIANVVEHARLVHALGILRRMGGTLRDLAAQSDGPEASGDVTAFVERCEAEVFAVSAGAKAASETGALLHDLMASAVITLDPSRPRESRGMTTGLRELDALTLGLRGGELWYVAGRPGMGKTSLAIGMLTAVAKTGRHGLLFSLEMGNDELQERLISMESGVPLKAIVNREVSREHYERVLDAASDLGKLPVFLDADPRITPSRLRSRVRRRSAMLRKRYPYGLGLIVVDYVQLMADDDRKTGNRQDELERISRSLKLLAKEFMVPVVALSQMNRPTTKGGGLPRPTMVDLRGSGALEQDADKVLFVHRDEGDGEDSRGESELILAKARNASQGKVMVRWEPWCARFLDATQAGFDFDRARYAERDE